MVPAETWGVHAVGIAPTERVKLRRQMAAAAGKKSTTSLSLFMEGREQDALETVQINLLEKVGSEARV